MKLFNFIKGSRAFQLISCLFVVVYMFGLLNNYFNDKNDYCDMTFMFEYPQYVKITMDKNENFPQYGLYAYSEGRFTVKARQMRFDGIPVLYLPGNSGSHMQARSLASVALRKSLSHKYDYHFDFFTINFNEELSGLYGGVLNSQTEFAAACISKILSLYKSNEFLTYVPMSVILIGHSMGGVIAKRLMVHEKTMNTTSLAIALAAPLEAPVINIDSLMNSYYLNMELAWNDYEGYKEIDGKFLISIGSGPRDVLVPAGLTSSNDSYVNVMATAIPGVWLSPDHISIVWCKQLVMVINRFLFDVVDPFSQQLTRDSSHIASKAKQYFMANRAMVLDPKAKRPNVIMEDGAFWYEDNRRIYQIIRPESDSTTHLMIRLATFPQNRFLAVEAINISNKDWIFGCNAKYTNNNYRYCKEATSLSELSRWTGAAARFGKRKLATVNLHQIMAKEPNWTHVVVKVSPAMKSVTLNVDTNDLASRQINVYVPWPFTFEKETIIAKTEPNSLYYELILDGFNWVHQAYLLYVEPINCNERYHASAELHVPWANHEMFHYFTPLKRSPMKLRLFKSNTNLILGLEERENAKVTLLLDPKCTFSISISHSWYNRLGQVARHYSPILLSYVSAIVLLTTRIQFMHLRNYGECISIHSALMEEGIKPYYPLVFSRVLAASFGYIPILSVLGDVVTTKNLELQYFTKSLLVLPAYLTALGIVHIAAAAMLFIMVFSSQTIHKFLFRIVWRGGSGLAENVATRLRNVPLLVSVALVCATPASCGAVSLVAGAAFYAFMLSKMYEEYFEDYIYKRMSKMASKICRAFTAKQQSATNLNTPEATQDPSTDEENTEEKDEIETTDETKNLISESKSETVNAESDEKEDEEFDEDLNDIHFHLMMFYLWMVVTVMNIPALLTWARNFQYSTVLKPDTSFHTGLTMSICSAFAWQIKGPKCKLLNYEAVALLSLVMAVVVLAIGPFLPAYINECVTLIFIVITLQQYCDKDVLKKCTCEKKNWALKTANKSNDSAKVKVEKSKESESNDPSPSDSNIKATKTDDDKKSKKSQLNDQSPSDSNIKAIETDNDKKPKKSESNDQSPSDSNIKATKTDDDKKSKKSELNDQSPSDSNIKATETDNDKKSKKSESNDQSPSDSNIKATKTDNDKKSKTSELNDQSQSDSNKEASETDDDNNDKVNDDIDQNSGDGDVRNDNIVYNVFKNLKEKLGFNENI